MAQTLLVGEGMRYVRPNPQMDRQVAPDSPMVFWRDRADGRREGLMVVAWACPFPDCDDRHLDLAVYLLDGAAGDVELDEFGIWTVEREGVVEDLEQLFIASFDLDQERLEVEPCASPAHAAWLRRELDGEVAAALQERFRSCRARTEELARCLSSRARPRVRRNERCPCGSGKKYKRCCLGTA